MNILDTIGNTPLVELKRVVPIGSARVMAKLEWTNPTGSMKDRMARAAIEGAVLGDDKNLPVLFQGLTLLNVTPLDLGEQARKGDEHKIVLMIPKNTPYPTEEIRAFFVIKIRKVF